jgi:hypothetical protein
MFSSNHCENVPIKANKEFEWWGGGITMAAPWLVPSEKILNI